MAPIHRKPRSQHDLAAPDASKVAERPRAGAFQISRRLLEIQDLPPWYAQPYILTGYRPVQRSVQFCLGSLTYLHNESVNIYSHLLPALVCLVALLCITRVSFCFDAVHDDVPAGDRAIVAIHLASSLTCFAVSSLYHTLLCHSQRYLDLWVRLDYIGILGQILGSFISGIYVGFYCEPALQRLHWSMISSFCTLTGVVVLHPRLQAVRFRPLRTAAFVATGLSAFAVIAHAATIFPYHQLDKQAGLRYYYIEGLLLLSGTWFFLTRFPESRHPGRFDIWGSSHQLFHALVVTAAGAHIYGVLDALKWNRDNNRCSPEHG